MAYLYNLNLLHLDFKSGKIFLGILVDLIKIIAGFGIM